MSIKLFRVTHSLHVAADHSDQTGAVCGSHCVLCYM